MNIARWYCTTVVNADDNREAAFVSIPAAALADRTILIDSRKTLSALGLSEFSPIERDEFDQIVLALVAGLDPARYGKPYTSIASHLSSELTEFKEYLMTEQLIPVEQSPMTPAGLGALAKTAGWMVLVATSPHPFLVIGALATGVVVFKVAEGIGDVLQGLIKELGNGAKAAIKHSPQVAPSPTSKATEATKELKEILQDLSKQMGAIVDKRSGSAGHGQEQSRPKPKTRSAGERDGSD